MRAELEKQIQDRIEQVHRKQINSKAQLIAECYGGRCQRGGLVMEHEAGEEGKGEDRLPWWNTKITFHGCLVFESSFAKIKAYVPGESPGCWEPAFMRWHEEAIVVKARKEERDAEGRGAREAAEEADARRRFGL